MGLLRSAVLFQGRYYLQWHSVAMRFADSTKISSVFGAFCCGAPANVGGHRVKANFGDKVQPVDYKLMQCLRREIMEMRLERTDIA